MVCTSWKAQELTESSFVIHQVKEIYFMAVFLLSLLERHGLSITFSTSGTIKSLAHTHTYAHTRTTT